MFCMMKFDNCKKLSKATKLSKRVIRLVDSLDCFDVGYNGNALSIAVDAHNITKPFVRIYRTDFGKIHVAKWDDTDHKSAWYKTDVKSQAEALLDAIAWLIERG